MDINLWVGFVRLYNLMVINVKKDWCNENKKKRNKPCQLSRQTTPAQLNRRKWIIEQVRICFSPCLWFAKNKPWHN